MLRLKRISIFWPLQIMGQPRKPRVFLQKAIGVTMPFSPSWSPVPWNPSHMLAGRTKVTCWKNGKHFETQKKSHASYRKEGRLGVMELCHSTGQMIAAKVFPIMVHLFFILLETTKKNSGWPYESREKKPLWFTTKPVRIKLLSSPCLPSKTASVAQPKSSGGLRWPLRYASVIDDVPRFNSRHVLLVYQLHVTCSYSYVPQDVGFSGDQQNCWSGSLLIFLLNPLDVFLGFREMGGGVG